MPPNSARLEQHIRRTNYITEVWKTAHIAKQELPKTWEGHRWLSTGEPLVFRSHDFTRVFDWYIRDNINWGKEQGYSDEVMSDGKEVINQVCHHYE